MGSTISYIFKVTPRAYLKLCDSPSGRGNSFITGSLESFYDDARDLYYELVMTQRRSPWDPAHTIEDSGPLSFNMTHNNAPMSLLERHEGIPLDAIPKDTAVFKLMQICFCDTRQRRFNWMSFYQRYLLERTFWQVLEEPVRLEVWCETPGERVENHILMGVIQRYLEEIIKRKAKDPLKVDSLSVKVDARADPISWPAKETKVVLTQALDEFIDYDSLWDEWVDVLKYQHYDSLWDVGDMAGLKYMEVQGEESPEAYFTTFTVTHVIDKAVVGAVEDEENVRRFQLNKLKGWIFVEEWNMTASKAPKRTMIYIHQNPLRIEAVAEDAGKRDVSSAVYAFAQVVVDTMIQQFVERKAKADLEAGMYKGPGG